MATKKKLELSTNLIGLDGFFCTYWGYGKAEHCLYEDRIKEDFEDCETDIHPDYYFSHFDNKKYMESWSKRVLDVVEELFNDLAIELGIDIEFEAGGYSSPREYNFRHDVSNFSISVDEPLKIIAVCLGEKEDFEEFLIENYSSYDGFMSFTANTLEEVIEDLAYDRDWETNSYNL